MKLYFPAVALAFVAVLLSAQPAGVLGNWKTPAGSIVRIDRCGSQICLRLVQLIAARGVTTDIHNPSPALRNRPLCGLTIGSGFTLTDPGHASGGTLYDPKTGKTYRGTIAGDGSTLHLRGYAGIPLFGASQTWTRPTEPVEPCATAQPPTRSSRASGR